MKRGLCVLALGLVLSGCAAYKELEPDPPVVPAERGYVELKSGKDNFELSRDKKYFVKFPPPLADHFKLVLTIHAKPVITSLLTRDFEKKDPPFVPIGDEAQGSDSVMVYALDTRSPMFYWVVDSVRQDVVIPMRYRYVPEWRYTFEARYAAYRETLALNTAERDAYMGIGPTTDLDALNSREQLASLGPRTAILRSLRNELKSLAQVFPENLSASQDTAYKQYQALSGKLADELSFQENFTRVLQIVEAERSSRGDMGAFLAAAPSLTDNLSHAGEFPPAAGERMRSLVSTRLGDIVPYYDRLLSTKNDIGRVLPQPSVEDVANLYRATGKQMPSDVSGLLRFIQRYNAESSALANATSRLKELDQQLPRSLPTAGEQFFTAQAARAAQIRQSIPDAQAGAMPKYGNYSCAVQLTQGLSNAVRTANDEQAMYELAGRASADIGVHAWAAAEDEVKRLANGSTFTSAGGIGNQRGIIVERFESELFTGVKNASQQRVDTFTKDHETTVDNVAALYQDSVFLPVYQLTFSSGGPAQLAVRRKEIGDYLDGIKYNQFPENSIKAIYAAFIRNTADKGVEKSRAIVEHGKYYRGNDKQVKSIEEECNPAVAKWVTKPREYRRLYALPTTTNPRGVNEYLFRLGLRIPSEAEFPVFDINIKLPQEVVQKAGSEKWYDEITLNKKEIKNEGRFRITAPVAANGYEAQISPVQMDKVGNNVLEVRFKYQGFRVFEVSAMAQVPLIRKN